MTGAQAGVSPRHVHDLCTGREPLVADLSDALVLETARRVDEAYAAAPLTASDRSCAGLAAPVARCQYPRGGATLVGPEPGAAR